MIGPVVVACETTSTRLTGLPWTGYGVESVPALESWRHPGASQRPLPRGLKEAHPGLSPSAAPLRGLTVVFRPPNTTVRPRV